MAATDDRNLALASAEQNLREWTNYVLHLEAELVRARETQREAARKIARLRQGEEE